MTMEQRCKKGQSKGHRQEKRVKRLNQLLIRLIVSAILFLAVFVGGHMIPDQVADVFGTARQMITADLNLRTSVETIGNSIRAGESIPAALREWCVDTFLPLSTDDMEKSQLQERLSISAVYHAHLISPQLDARSLRCT